MSDQDPPPEADRVDGAPHPRDTKVLLGQSAAEKSFLQAVQSGRLHHGWLIAGPRGVGKATLAWRIARYLLAENAAAGDGLFGDSSPAPATDTLTRPDNDPLARRVAALAEPRLTLVRRVWDPKSSRHKKDIGVDEIRRLKSFFNLSAADGGRRVVIVDTADEMTTNAANALLKLLEEPPDNAILLLISHQPSRLLPTIRSRCRVLRCEPLSGAEMAQALTAAGSETGDDAAALSELSGGSVGEAVRLSNLDGMAIYQDLVALFATLPDLDRPKALKLAESVAGAANEPRYDLVLRLLDVFVVRTARTGVSGPPIVEAATGEAALMTRLCGTPDAGRKWAELQQKNAARARHARAVNLDPAALILDMILRINELAGQLATR